MSCQKYVSVGTQKARSRGECPVPLLIPRLCNFPCGVGARAGRVWYRKCSTHTLCDRVGHVPDGRTQMPAWWNRTTSVPHFPFVISTVIYETAFQLWACLLAKWMSGKESSVRCEIPLAMGQMSGTALAKTTEHHSVSNQSRAMCLLPLGTLIFIQK